MDQQARLGQPAADLVGSVAGGEAPVHLKNLALNQDRPAAIGRAETSMLREAAGSKRPPRERVAHQLGF